MKLYLPAIVLVILAFVRLFGVSTLGAFTALLVLAAAFAIQIHETRRVHKERHGGDATKDDD